VIGYNSHQALVINATCLRQPRNERSASHPSRTGLQRHPCASPLVGGTAIWTTVDSVSAQTICVLDADPDLAAGLEPGQLVRARVQARARVLEVPGPEWDPTAIARVAGPGWIGLFLIKGLLVRSVTVGSRTACELFGPGDLLRPWDADGQYDPLVIGVAWRILQPTRLAVLDDRFCLRVSEWPAITAVLIKRVADRARALALGHAVSHLPQAHARLLIMFWLLADRWGRVGPEGITIPLPLTHETVAMLVGIRRPSATLALQRLARGGLLLRRRSDRWLLTNQAVELLGDVDSLALVDGSSDGLPIATGERGL
jgi:CRP/FNR family cyclic AMP-dependent transcriptional regulator